MTGAAGPRPGRAPAEVVVVGPLPPPEGGMANQTAQLVDLLRSEGLAVGVVRVNPPHRPAWIGRVRGLRAVVRLAGYVWRLWRAAGRAEVFHVMANSGWAWYLFAMPAVVVARLRGPGCVLNYRGGEAEAFFARSFRWVRPVLGLVDAIAVPSGYLREVFASRGTPTHVVPNVVDLERFSPAGPDPARDPAAPHLIVTRNLEPIYGNEVAIRALARIRETVSGARLSLAGAGPERERLAALAREIGLGDAVAFTGRLTPERMPDFYRGADVMLNPSLVDNTPNAILEAWASGVPVATSDAGGIPHLVVDGESGLIVPRGDPEALAGAALRLLTEERLRRKVIDGGRRAAERFTWPQVKPILLDLYHRAGLAAPAARLESPT